jgi:hypothetical protein
MDDRVTDEPPGPEPWGELPPWELPGGFRFDGEPHRGPLLCELGHAALMAGWLSVLPACFPCCAPAAILLGMRVWTMTSRDLALMQRGQMDTRGQEATELGRCRARKAVFLALLGFLVWGAVFVYFASYGW